MATIQMGKNYTKPPGHETFLEIYLDIDDISDFVDFHVSRKWDCSMLLEWTREHVSGTATITFWVCHFADVLSYGFQQENNEIIKGSWQF